MTSRFLILFFILLQFHIFIHPIHHKVFNDHHCTLCEIITHHNLTEPEFSVIELVVKSVPTLSNFKIPDETFSPFSLWGQIRSRAPPYTHAV